MTKMNKKTKAILRDIAEVAWSEHGEDIFFAAYPLAEYNRLAKRHSLNLSYQSIAKYQNYIETILRAKKKDLEKERSISLTVKDDDSDLQKMIDALDKHNEPVKDEPKTKTLIKTINLYDDGSYEIIENNSNNEEEDYTQPVQRWTGFFNYDDNKAVVRRGRYKGCDIKNPNDIFKHFDNVMMFEGWCSYSIRTAENPDFVGRCKDTDLDIETLKKAKMNVDKLYKIEKAKRFMTKN